MNYKDEMVKSMNLLAQNDYLFVGQSTRFTGNMMFNTLVNIPMNQRIESFVGEEFQLGQSTGMVLNGLKVCSLFPRMDFLILAMNQLVNHLDKISLLSEGRFKPHVIIRTSVGGKKQLDPGLQHVGNYIEPLRQMLKTVNVVELNAPEMICPEYAKAFNSDVSSILVEFGDLYEG